MRRSGLPVLLLVFVMIFVVACSGTPETPGNNGEEPTEGGTVILVVDHDADSLDPHESMALTSREIYNCMYDRLVYIATDGSPQPWLAEEWTISENGQEIVFQLVEDRTFHDGTPVNAEAVKYTFDRMLDPERGSSAATQFGAIEDIVVEDEFSVRFVLSEPYAPIFNSLASAYGAIISPTAADELGDTFGRNPVGSGPFMFESWVPGTEIVFVKNPDYTTLRKDVENKGAPHVDSIVFTIVSEESTQTNALKTGDVHIAPIAVTQANSIAGNSDINLVVMENAFNINYIEFNQYKAPFDDILVRKAVGFAVDPQEIIDVVYFGHGNVNGSMLPTGVAGHNEAIAEEYGFTYDLDEARALLAEAGWVDTDNDGVREKDGEELEVEILSWTSTTVDRITQLLQSQLAEVGIKVEINLMDAGTFLAKGKELNQHFDFMRTTWAEPIILSRALGQGGLFKNFNWPEFDEFLNEAATTVVWEDRKQVLDEAQIYILENALAVPLFTDHIIKGVRAEVTGYKWDALGWEILNDMKIDGSK